MLFNSLHYLIFFPIVVCLYFAIPHRWRWMLLLAASYYFYMSWKVEYVVLIFISTVTAYCTALLMGRCRDLRCKRAFLVLSLVVNLGLLFGFKYFNFVNDNMRDLFAQVGIAYRIPRLRVLLPVGISFYTFQTLSYTIDVFRGDTEPERHLGIFAVYVSFFPQLVAGPIERSHRLLPQFFRRVGFDYQRVTSGLKLMMWGYFKKVLIADRLAVLVDAVYGEPSGYPGFPMLVATFFFAFQIYCDFSGYSDIAIGSARIIGYELMENFRRPYFAASIAEFWKRWHISLSTWFRDYFYISIGGNRVPIGRWYINLMATFVVSGFWHGANWTFLAWGVLHGSYLVTEIVTKGPRERTAALLGVDRIPALRRALGIAFTNLLVLFAWIFFRADSLADAFFIIRTMFVDVGNIRDLGNIAVTFRGMGLQGIDLFYSFFFIGLLLIYDLVDSRENVWKRLDRKPAWARWAVYYAIVILLLFFTPYNKAQNFIYFQF